MNPTAPLREDGKRQLFAGIPDQELRKFLLYWDVIDCPVANNFTAAHEDSVDGYELLKSEGVLTEPKIVIDDDQIHLDRSGELSEEYTPFEETKVIDPEFMEEKTKNSALAQFASLVFKNQNRPEQRWSSTEHGIFFPKENLALAKSAQIRLLNLLPVPSESVPVRKILEFKENRRALLSELWAGLDGLYLEVAESADPEKASDIVETRLESALNGLAKTLEEEEINHWFSPIQVQLKLDSPSETAAKVAGGFGAGTYAGFEVAVGLGLSIGAMSVIDVSYQEKEAPDFDLQGMDYLYGAGKEGIINSELDS